MYNQLLVLQTIMISPQSVKLTTSPNHKAELEFDVMLADVPVDIYLLMDLSASMRDHKDNLINSANTLPQHVLQLTADAKFGFGSFSDKPTPPFSKPPHLYAQRNQTVPYSFEHKVMSKLPFVC